MVDWNGMVGWNSTYVISISGHLSINITSNKDLLMSKLLFRDSLIDELCATCYVIDYRHYGYV